MPQAPVGATGWRVFTLAVCLTHPRATHCEGASQVGIAVGNETLL